MSFFDRWSSFQISFALHGFLAMILLILSLDFIDFKKAKTIRFEVIENPVVAPPNLVLQPKNVTKPAEPVKPIPENTQKVFGVSRKAITSSQADTDAASVKQGNTIAKENDDLKLKDTDPDSLPIPADDYLVTSTAKLISSVQANRTDEARKAGYTGTAILLILIDQNGVVREATLLNKLDFGLDERALEIAKTLKFIPAKVKDDPVATKIRFSINFKSSN